MKQIPYSIACGLVGLFLGYGLMATLTSAQLAAAAESAETLELSPIMTPSSSSLGGGGSCG